jgi:hypothetical protein
VDFPRYLLRLSELELLDPERRATERRIRQARLDVVKSLDSFDFLAIPSLNKALVLELARCEFIERKENILALGNSGTGKTHIALALGLAACQKGFRVRFTTAASLAHELIEAKDERRLMRFQSLLSSFELLIIDWASCRCPKPGPNCCLRPKIRTQCHAGDQQPSVQRMDRGLRIRAADRSLAGPAHPSRPHSGNEWGKLPAQGQQAATDPEATFLATPVYGGDLQGRLPLRPKRASPSGSQACAAAAPANPQNKASTTRGLAYFSSAPVV